MHFHPMSSNINEVITAVLNFLFFYEKISPTLKELKVLKALNGTKTLGQKHKNVNKRISDYLHLRCFLKACFIFVRS